MLQGRERITASPKLKTRGEVEEVALVARVAEGDRDAFESLYRLYHPRLTRFLDRMTRRPQLVEELTNDTMWVVWRSGARFNGESKVSTWIFAIAYRKALKALSRIDDSVPWEEADDEREAAEPGPEQLLGHRQLHSVLRRALNELSPDHRAVVDLSYFHDIGYREIAEIVDCPVDTVKTRMFYARRRLRALLPGSFVDWV